MAQQWCQTQVCGQQLPAPRDASCTLVISPPAKPQTLLDTLRAAAQDSAMQWAGQRADCLPCAWRSPQEASVPQPVEAQELAEAKKRSTAGCATQILARAGDPKLQPIQLKRSGSRVQRNPVTGPESPTGASPSNAVAEGSTSTRFMHKARNELLRLETEAPWDAVRRSWKAQRPTWRKNMRNAETLVELIDGIREFRTALAIPGSPFNLFGGPFDQSLDQCSRGEAPLDQISSLLAELKSNVKSWVDLQKSEQRSEPLELSHGQKAVALRAMEALSRAAALGNEALSQCPLEAILDYDLAALGALRDVLEREMKLQCATAFIGGSSIDSCVVSGVFTRTLSGHWEIAKDGAQVEENSTQEPMT